MRYLLFIVIAVTLAWNGTSVAGDSSVFGSVSKGKAYFSKRCAMCHGQNGHGKNGMAPDFSVEWERLTKSDNELAANIRNRYSDPTNKNYYNAGNCPSHPAITDDDMEDILAFLRRLAEQNNQDGLLDQSNDFFDKQFDDFNQKRDPFDRKRDPFERESDFFDK